MKKLTLFKYSSLLILFSLIGVLTLINNPLAKTTKAKPAKYWKERNVAAYYLPVPANASPFEGFDQEPNGPIEAGTPPNMIKYDIRLDSNCAIERCQYILQHYSHFNETTNTPAKSTELLANLKTLANYPMLRKDMNSFEVLNLHDVLQSKINLSLNQAMIKEINDKCAKRVYYYQE